MPFVPDDFVVPERLEMPQFTIRKLMFRDAQLDYDAVMSSNAIIKATRGGDVLGPNLTFEENQIDLAFHQREFEYRAAFSYTVMAPDESACMGCVYIYPPDYRTGVAVDGDVDVSFWVTQAGYDTGLYPVLYKTIQDWLPSWPFKKVVFSNVKLPA